MAGTGRQEDGKAVSGHLKKEGEEGAGAAASLEAPGAGTACGGPSHRCSSQGSPTTSPGQSQHHA